MCSDKTEVDVAAQAIIDALPAKKRDRVLEAVTCLRQMAKLWLRAIPVLHTIRDILVKKGAEDVVLNADKLEAEVLEVLEEAE